MKQTIFLGILGLLGIIHNTEMYTPLLPKYKVGQCLNGLNNDNFVVASYKEDIYIVIYLDGLLAVVKAKVYIDRKLIDVSFVEITCPKGV